MDMGGNGKNKCEQPDRPEALVLKTSGEIPCQFESDLAHHIALYQNRHMDPAQTRGFLGSNPRRASCENQKPPRGSQWLTLISDIH